MNPNNKRILLCATLILAAQLFVSMPALTQEGPPATLAERIQQIIDRPEFAHANFGIEFHAPESGKVIYALNEQKLFIPASTTKTLTEGTLLARLGADYRFHTRIYRTGQVDRNGRLEGNLVLVASGDPNLSNRIRHDGTLAFEDEDHSYGGPPVAGDPLTVIRQLAKEVVAKGIRRIDGRVVVDASLFPDAEPEGGTGVVVSSIVVNDNVIDLTARPGVKEGDPVILDSSPKTAYAKFVNQLTTTAAGSKPELRDPVTTENSDGTVTVTLRGSLPFGAKPITAPYAVPSPTRFAEVVLRECLIASGIRLKTPSKAPAPDFKGFAEFYTEGNMVAEHVSLPLSEEIKVTLKVSQNLHAGMGPYLLGALVAKNAQDPLHAGFKVEREFLQSAGLDLSGASQGDGEGGDRADLFSPHFMCRYLAFWTTRPDFELFFKGLPVLGKDGTLAEIQKDSPAAGHVFAKTGTYGSEDKLGGRMMLNAKGLVGYVVTASGQRLVFAAYVNNVHLPPDPEAAQKVAGQALGEIAAAAYNAP